MVELGNGILKRVEQDNETLNLVEHGCDILKVTLKRAKQDNDILRRAEQDNGILNGV